MLADQGIFAYTFEMFPAKPEGGGFYPLESLIAQEFTRNRPRRRGHLRGRLQYLHRADGEPVRDRPTPPLPGCESGPQRRPLVFCARNLRHIFGE
jgi:hypothetical protein